MRLLRTNLKAYEYLYSSFDESGEVDDEVYCGNKTETKRDAVSFEVAETAIYSSHLLIKFSSSLKPLTTQKLLSWSTNMHLDSESLSIVRQLTLLRSTIHVLWVH